MQHLFVSQSTELLPNWLEAYPEASLHAELSEQTQMTFRDSIVWVHVNVNGNAWFMQQLELLQIKPLSLKVIVLSNAPSSNEGMQAIAKGALGYCHAYSDVKVLNQVASVVLNGGIWLGQDLLQSLITASSRQADEQEHQREKNLDKLTSREKEVALYAAKGFSNKEIARAINISDSTVKAHLSSSFERLGVRDRLQLALLINDPGYH